MTLSTLTPRPPCEVRAENRKTKNIYRWKSRAWKEARDIFLLQNPKCHYCSNPSKIVHHPKNTMYGPDYVDFSLCEAVCGSCNWYGHHRYERCDCGKGWRKPGAEFCPECIPDSLKETSEIRKIMKRKLRRDYERAARKRWREKIGL